MSDQTVSRHLPPPAPGFRGLVGIHARLLVKDAQAGTAVLAVACVALPLAALLTPFPSEPADVASAISGPMRLQMLMSMMVMLTVGLAFLWPEAVWKGLGPGERAVLDSFPVTRRNHRMARVVAGGFLPLALTTAYLGSATILRVRGWGDVMPGMTSAYPDLAGWSAPTAVLVLLTAYLLSSSLALRFGKVFVPLLVIGTGVYLVPASLLLAGKEEWIEAIARSAVEWTWSPFRLFSIMFSGGPSDVLPALFWMTALAALTIHLAGRHGKV